VAADDQRQQNFQPSRRNRRKSTKNNCSAKQRASKPPLDGGVLSQMRLKKSSKLQLTVSLCRIKYGRDPLWCESPFNNKLIKRKLECNFILATFGVRREYRCDLRPTVKIDDYSRRTISAQSITN
jgi:hypothetical protein